MRHFFLCVWRWLRAEIVFGFLIGSVFWAAVLGWQAAYAPTDAEKQKCYDAAEHAGHKTEECRSFWERSTSDPVAFFTLVLAISTIGLWSATVFLYRAGEKQSGHARRSAAIQSRDMQASIKVAQQSADVAKQALFAQRAELAVDRFLGDAEVTANENGQLTITGYRFVVVWQNTGASVASIRRMDSSFAVGNGDVHEGELDQMVPSNEAASNTTIVRRLGSGQTCVGPSQTRPISEVLDLFHGRARLFLYTGIFYSDIFEPEKIRHTEVLVEVTTMGDPLGAIDTPSREIFEYRSFGRKYQTAT